MTNTATLTMSNNTNNCGKLKYIGREREGGRETELELENFNTQG